jgi:hypothetical protein
MTRGTNMTNDYMQTNDLDYASPEEQEEYNRYLDILETIISSRVPDVMELQEQAADANPDVDLNPDDECLEDCGSEF